MCQGMYVDQSRKLISVYFGTMYFKFVMIRLFENIFLVSSNNQFYTLKIHLSH